jgi:hypothetical protein
VTMTLVVENVLLVACVLAMVVTVMVRAYQGTRSACQLCGNPGDVLLGEMTPDGPIHWWECADCYSLPSRVRSESPSA